VSGATKLGSGLNGLLILLLATGAGGLIAMSPDIALPMAVLVLPGLLALIIDRSPGCGVARTILLFQAAACVHPVVGAWYRCAGIDRCMNYLTDWSTVVRVWLAAAAAWVLAQILPIALKVLDDYRLSYRRASLSARRETLVDEWGLEDESEQ
jgi:hypothetical protein